MDYGPTLSSLINLGFAKAESVYGMPTVICPLPCLELSCRQGMNQYFREVVFVTGILNTGRVLKEINSEVPVDLHDPTAAAAWLVYILRGSFPHNAADLPPWFAIGLENQDFLPMLAQARRTGQVSAPDVIAPASQPELDKEAPEKNTSRPRWTDPDYGSKNTLVTRERADELRRRLKKKLRS